MSICLLQEPLEPVLVAPSIARRTIPETEIRRACQRSSTAGDGGGTASCRWVTPAPHGCILLISPPDSDERCFALTRAETGVKCCPVRPGGQ